MNKSLSLFSKRALRTVEANGPTILTGLAVSGVVLTGVLADDAGKKAQITFYNETYPKTPTDGWLALSKKDKFLLSWKYYIPAAVMGLVTIGCVIGANSLHLRRNAALAGLYAVTEASLMEYQKKIIDTLGDKKAEKIQHEIMQDRINETPLNEDWMTITGKGETVCYDAFSGRYFKSDVEAIRRSFNDFNKRLIEDVYLPLNDLYEELGLDSIKMGWDIGWNVEYGLVYPTFSSMLTKDNRPVLVLDFKVTPRKL